MKRQILPYTIRPMEPGDVPTVSAIERLVFPTPWPASSFLYELRPNTRSFYYVLLRPATGEATLSGQRWRRWLRGVLGLPKESRVIGYVGARLLDAEEAHVSTIAVHPDWRGKGLGELLLLTVMEKALELGCGVVTLEMRSSNRVAHHLYRKYGFRFDSVRQGYYRDGEDAWLMKVKVNQNTWRARLTNLRQTLEAHLCRQPLDVGQNDGDRL